MDVLPYRSQQAQKSIGHAGNAIRGEQIRVVLDAGEHARDAGSHGEIEIPFGGA